jgi:PAS domain S-box-containing protein
MNRITSPASTTDVATEMLTNEGTFGDATRPIDSSQDQISRDTTIIPPPEVQWIYDTAPVGLACLSTDCRYVLINQRLTEICGISIADHIGRSVRETVPQVADQVEKIVQTILRNGTPIIDVEINGQRTDEFNGDRFWSTSWHPLKGPDGSILGINVVAEEITERKRAEAALVASEARFRELSRTLEQRVEAQARERDRTWNVSQDLLVVADSTGKSLSVNPAWTTVLGWSEAELLDKAGDWLIHPDDMERTAHQLTQLVTGGRTLHFENRLRHKNGSYRWFSWTGVFDRDQIYAAGRDITELRRAQAEVRRSQDELARINRQTTMAAMTASIAHEINQPLSAIVTNGGAALRWLARVEPDNDEARKAINRVIEDAHRAGEVISSVRAMFGNDQRRKEPLTLNDLIKDVLSIIHGEFESHHVGLQMELEGTIPNVLGDRVQIQQVLLNLFTNAIEAMTSVGGRPRLLSIKSGVNGQDSVLITVKDSGPGIDSPNVDRIFDAFFTTKPHGMGMGLSICRSIVENHGSRLWAEPGNPVGTMFLVTLPVVASSLSTSDAGWADCPGTPSNPTIQLG